MNISYFQSEEKPYGMSFGSWTVKWWQWLLAKPLINNPANDPTGKNNSLDQKYDDVWFLAGTFDGMEPAKRQLTIPSHKAILVPAICYQVNFLEDPVYETEEQMRNEVSNDMNDVDEYKVTIDDVDVEVYRIQSDPIAFPVRITKDIPHGKHSSKMRVMKGDMDTTAISDGYWAFIKPLPLGIHKLHLLGSTKDGRHRTEAFYDINVTESKQ